MTPCRKARRRGRIANGSRSSSSQYELASWQTHRPNLETALHQKVIHHHVSAQEEIKFVTKDRQSMRLQAEKLQADMEENEKFAFGAWEALRAADGTPRRRTDTRRKLRQQI